MSCVTAELKTLRDNKSDKDLEAFKRTTELGKKLHERDFEPSELRVSRRQLHALLVIVRY